MTRRQPLIYCQRNLLIAWLVGLSPALIIMIIRTVLGAYSGRENDVWAWFIPMFLPTLSLMIGAYSSSVLNDEIEAVTVDKFFFVISLWLTGFYLFLLTSVIVYQPFSSSPALETLSRSSIFLGVIQGMTSGCIGVFFVSQKK
jgi:ABC-type uncharacterized transport system YnjBCD permease subunit